MAKSIEQKLAEGETQEAWRLLKGWYRSAEDRPSKPCHDAMTKQTKDRETLYAKVSPPGASIPINVQPFDIKDDVPEEPEIRAVVKGLRNGRAGGASGMCAEHIKQWLRDMIVEEEDGKEGLGDKWRLFIELIQIVWAEGEIPQQMAWMTVVLLPKGGGDYRGIGLLEPFWKVVEILMDGRMEAINFHDCLHGFLKGRGTGTATIEAKLAQQLAFIEQEALYSTFIDLRKAYDAMDRERCLEILEGYGVGPNMLRLITAFWDMAVLVCRAGGRYGTPFQAFRGVTQGGPLSPRIFNVMVDAVVRAWIAQMLGAEAAEHGYGEELRKILAIFYADDALLASRDPALLQEALDVMVALFERVGLRTNTAKTKVMICVPGKIRTRHTSEVYNNSREGLLWVAEHQNRIVTCDICDQELQAVSLDSHLATQHEVYRSKVIDQELLVVKEPQTFKTSVTASGRYICPVPDCAGTATTKWSMRRHFGMRHPSDLIHIAGEGCFPRCKRCHHQVNPTALGHSQTKNCREGYERRLQHEAAATAGRSLERDFTAYSETLERVEVFKYLGRLLSYNDDDTQAVRSNLRKARKVWGRISRVLRAENASARVCGKFYKATVQAVLLFGSETWNLTPPLLKSLEGFHLRAAWRMTHVHKPRRNPDRSWTYPATEDVMEEAGLYPAAHYVDVRRQTIARFIVNRPIYGFCEGSERQRGTSPRQWWWEQPMDLDVARAEAPASDVVAAED